MLTSKLFSNLCSNVCTLFQWWWLQQATRKMEPGLNVGWLVHLLPVCHSTHLLSPYVSKIRGKNINTCTCLSVFYLNDYASLSCVVKTICNAFIEWSWAVECFISSKIIINIHVHLNMIHINCTGVTLLLQQIPRLARENKTVCSAYPCKTSSKVSHHFLFISKQ